LNVDPDDGEIEISFMENKKDKFQWPRHGDVLWIPSKDAMSIFAEPFLSGRSERMLQLRTKDKDIFDKFFSKNDNSRGIIENAYINVLKLQ
jgi:hypothetical protein